MSTTVQALYQRHHLTVDDYHRMGEAGIFNEGDRVELIDGEIVDMSPIGSIHAGTVAQLASLLSLSAGQKAIIWLQNPIVLSGQSEPEPDLALLRPRDDFYKSSHPTPSDVLLLIEVAESSLAYDREVKVPLYARHGLPEVWIVDLENYLLHVFREPAEGKYQDIQTLDQPGMITPAMLPEGAINLAEVF